MVLTSLCPANLAQFGGSFRLWRPEKRVGVLQPAAERHLIDIVVRSVAVHFPLAVWHYFGHYGTKRLVRRAKLKTYTMLSSKSMRTTRFLANKYTFHQFLRKSLEQNARNPCTASFRKVKNPNASVINKRKRSVDRTGRGVVCLRWLFTEVCGEGWEIPGS